MATISRQKIKKEELHELKAKAALLDELLELIEEKHLGHAMAAVENERNIPLARAKKLLR